ncbi:MAG: hypothetical protein IIY21_07640 [Clostridiales bacterium]|nr:hypothetical protein [Clostridiales bacterium]
MTNTEMWLDETISHIKSIKSDIWMLHEIMSLPNCNDCKNKDCEYKPKWGEHIRYNCPLHNADRKTEQTDCNGCKFVGTYDTEFPCANCSRKTKDYYAKDEPQTERSE